jgi:hypothetical protein
MKFCTEAKVYGAEGVTEKSEKRTTKVSNLSKNGRRAGSGERLL